MLPFPSYGLELFSLHIAYSCFHFVGNRSSLIPIFTLFWHLFIPISFYWHASISKGTIMLRSTLQPGSAKIMSVIYHCRSLRESEPVPCQKENLKKEDSCEEVHPQCGVQWTVCLWYSLWGSWRDKCWISGFGFWKGIQEWGDRAVGPGCSCRRNRWRALERDLWLSQETNC